jgi:hypothetical protein
MYLLTDPPLKAIPKGDWFCDDCATAKADTAVASADSSATAATPDTAVSSNGSADGSSDTVKLPLKRELSIDDDAESAQATKKSK